MSVSGPADVSIRHLTRDDVQEMQALLTVFGEAFDIAVGDGGSPAAADALE